MFPSVWQQGKGYMIKTLDSRLKPTFSSLSFNEVLTSRISLRQRSVLPRLGSAHRATLKYFKCSSAHHF